MYFIYYLTSEIDNYIPRYIGYTTDIDRRLDEHIKESKYNKSRSHKTNWINKLIKNKTSLIIMVLDQSDTLSSILEKERYYVEKYAIKYNLTNSTNGGESSKSFVYSVREQISKSLKEYYLNNDTWNKGLNYKFSKERNKKRRERMGDVISGENNHFYGKKHSLETKKKLSDINRKYNYNYEIIFNLYIRKNLTGAEISKELDMPENRVNRIIRRYNLKSIKIEIYGKIKGYKKEVNIDFDKFYNYDFY